MEQDRVELDVFAYRLSVLMATPCLGYVDISEHLIVASSLTTVELNTMAHDDSALYCRPAYEYGAAKEETLKPFVHALSRFYFLWSAFERTVKSIVPPVLQKKGVTRAATAYLYSSSDRCSSNMLLNIATELRITLEKSPYRDQINNATRLTNDKAENGVAIVLAAAVRNSIAHGDFQIPESEYYGESGSSDVCELINTAGFGVLATIQTILITSLTNNEAIQPLGTLMWWDECDEVGLRQALVNAHRKHFVDTDETDFIT